MAKAKRTIRKATAKERADYARAVREEERAMPENRALGRKLLADRSKRLAPARAVLLEMKTLVEERSITLQELEDRTGIARSNLSRLLNNTEPNITIDTLTRIAAALNCAVKIELVG